MELPYRRLLRLRGGAPEGQTRQCVKGSSAVRILNIWHLRNLITRTADRRSFADLGVAYRSSQATSSLMYQKAKAGILKFGTLAVRSERERRSASTREEDTKSILGDQNIGKAAPWAD